VASGGTCPYVDSLIEKMRKREEKMRDDVKKRQSIPWERNRRIFRERNRRVNSSSLFSAG